MALSRFFLFFLFVFFRSATFAQSVVDVSVPSMDLFNIDARRIEVPTQINIPAKFAVPAGSGPFPAIVVVDSSAGASDKVWARLLKDLPESGFAVLGLQTLQGRGQGGGVGTNQGAVSFLAPPADALFALKYLRGHPEVDPTRICVIGHSRGGQASFNFLYFNTFLKLADFKDPPFDCNISINSGGHYRPESLQATGRPALVFIGEKDDVWHMDLYRAFTEQVRDAGNPVEIVTIRDSFHLLTSAAPFCPKQMNAKGCREQFQYSEAGLRVGGQLITQKEGVSKCGGLGYHCGGEMDKYPEVLSKTLEFLRRAIPEPSRKK